MGHYGTNLWTFLPCNHEVDNYTSQGKGHPRTGHVGPEGEHRYSSTLSSTSALDGVGGQRYALADLPPGKTWYPLYRRLGGPQGRSGRVREISSTPVFDPWTVQSAASRYTDRATAAHTNHKRWFFTCLTSVNP